MLEKETTLNDFPTMLMVRTGNLVRMCARVTFLLLLVSIVGLVFVPWRQTARGVGTVLALDPQKRPQPLKSPSKGVVSYVREGLREGSYVRRDELLLKLTPIAADGVSQVDRQIVALRAKEDSIKQSLIALEQNEQLQISSGKSAASSLQQDVKAVRRKWEQAKNVIDEVRNELDDKKNRLRVGEDSIVEGLISKQELFSLGRDVDRTRAKLEKAENAEQEAYATMVGKEEAMDAKMREIDIKNREAANKILEFQQKINTIEKEILDLQNKRGELDRLDIRAPKSGYIQQWNGLEGSDTIKEGDPLFVIVPETDELAVEMMVSGNDMPLIKEGDRVRLQFEGWPAVQFVGWPSVAVGTFGGKINRVFPTDDGKGNFRVVVTPDNHFEREDGWPDERYLRQGVRANGWVLLNRVPLGYEIWRQLNGFPPVVENKESDKSKGSKLKLPKI